MSQGLGNGSERRGDIDIAECSDVGSVEEAPFPAGGGNAIGRHSPTLDELLTVDLTETDPAGSTEAELRSIAIDSVRPNGYQPRRRFDEPALSELADSIRELGVLQPILVRPLPHGEYELIAGERRWRAARRAGLGRIPAIVRVTSDLRSLEEAIVENVHRANLNAIEEANAYQQLVEDFSLTQDEVARRTGRSRSAVANTLRLLQLPGSVQRLIMTGRLSAGHARAVLAVPDPVTQRELAEYMVDARLSVRQAEELVKARSVDGGRNHGAEGSASLPSAPAKSAAALEVEQQLGDLLATKVVVTESSKNGKITIDFADRTDLDRIYSLLQPPDVA